MASLPDDLDLLRLEHLKDHVRQNRELLKEYEDTLLYEDDPIRRGRYKRQIDRLEASAQQNRAEYDRLQAKIVFSQLPDFHTVGTQIQEIDLRLRGQAHINMLTTKLSQQEQVTAQAVLDAIKQGHISQGDQQTALIAINQALAELHQNKAQLPEIPDLTGKTVEDLSKLVNVSDLETDHKLILTLPIIPFILSYQAEVGLSAAVNLKSIWQHLTAKIRGKS